ncbi:MAG: hypothetical protein HY683_00205 [Chloroflexi bacterium]|nr:hypothetical protein [Chloroflexota bacterium]
MIWLRRSLAVLLAIGFVLLFPLVLVALRVNATLLDPSFVKDELRKADVFTFAYDEYLPAALPETFGQDLEGLPKALLGKQITPQDALAAAKEVAPPSWLEQQVEGAIDQAWPYFTGRADHFAIVVPLSDRVDAAVPVVKRTLRQTGAYTFVSSPEFVTELDRQLRNFGNLPFGLTVNGSQLSKALQRIVPPDWLQSQAEGALDAVVPYFEGKQDSFKITVHVADRVEPGAAAIKDLLRETDAYRHIFDAVVSKLVEDNVGQAVNLPLGVTVTKDEIGTLAQQALPPQWLQEQGERLLDQAVPYLKGETASFTITLPLDERKPQIKQALAGLVDGKLRALFDALPQCSLPEFLAKTAGAATGRLPDCRPQGYSYEEAKRTLGMDVAAGVEQGIVALLPGQWNLSLSDLLSRLSTKDRERLDSFRKTVREGWVYTDTDLQRVLAKNADTAATVDKVRTAIRDGWRYTDADLRKDLERQDGGQATLQSLDNARRWLGLVGRLAFLPYLIGIAVLAIIGLLGGRGVRGRLLWAAAPLVVASLIVIVASAVVYSAAVGPALESALANARDTADRAQLLAAAKGIAVARTLVQDFLAGIRAQAILFLVLGLVLAAIGLAWPRLAQRISRPSSTPT